MRIDLWHCKSLVKRIERWDDIRKKSELYIEDLTQILNEKMKKLSVVDRFKLAAETGYWVKEDGKKNKNKKHS